MQTLNVPREQRLAALEDVRQHHPDDYDVIDRILHGLWRPDIDPIADPASSPAALTTARNQLVRQCQIWLNRMRFGEKRRDMMTQYDALCEANIVLLSHDVCSLVLDILSTTGVDQSWFDLVPKHVLYACPAQVSPLIRCLLPYDASSSDEQNGNALPIDTTFGNVSLGLISTQQSTTGNSIRVGWAYESSPIAIACSAVSSIAAGSAKTTAIDTSRDMIRVLSQGDPHRTSIYLCPIATAMRLRSASLSTVASYIDLYNRDMEAYVGDFPDSVTFAVLRFLAAAFALAKASPFIKADTSDTRTKREIKQARKCNRTNDRPYKVTTIHVTDAPQASTTGSHDHIEYHHRWIVSGHFRNQPYGPGGSLRRRQWIPPYIKGPAGAPLLNRTKILSIK